MRKLVLAFVAITILSAYACTHPPQQEIPKPRRSSPQTTASQQPTEEELKAKVAQLLEQLASERYQERESAQARLGKLLRSDRGGIALECLRRHRHSVEDMDLSIRLDKILKPYNHWRILPAILDILPNAAELLDEKGISCFAQALEKLNNNDSGGATLTMVVEQLSEMLKIDDWQTRGDCADALVKIGKPAVDALIRTLEDDNANVRFWAADALGRIGGSKSVHHLIKALGDKHRFVRGIAANGLGEIGDKGAVAPLIHTLKDKDVSVCVSAAQALGRIGDPKAVEPLLEFLKDKPQHVFRFAALALGKIGDRRATRPLCEAISSDWRLREARYYAAEALGDLGDPDAVEPLLKLLKGKDRTLRFAAAKALGKIGDKRAQNQLIEALSDKFEGVRSMAALALGKLKSEKAIEPLIGALKSPSNYPEVWTFARDALAEIGGPAIPALSNALKHKNPVIRCGAAQALGLIGREEAIASLVGAFDDPDWRPRQAAVEALVMIGKPALGALAEKLKDNSASIRWYAIDTFEKIGDINTLGPLIEILQDKEKWIRSKAANTLQLITKKNFGENYDKWKEWYEKNKGK